MIEIEIKREKFIRVITDNGIYTLESYNDKDTIITQIIREKYSASQVEAIVNNYLSDMSNEEYAKEFNELQEWRKKAKSIARKVNDFIQENDLINKPDGVYEIKN